MLRRDTSGGLRRLKFQVRFFWGCPSGDPGCSRRSLQGFGANNVQGWVRGRVSRSIRRPRGRGLGWVGEVESSVSGWPDWGRFRWRDVPCIPPADRGTGFVFGRGYRQRDRLCIREGLPTEGQALYSRISDGMCGCISPLPRSRWCGMPKSRLRPTPEAASSDPPSGFSFGTRDVGETRWHVVAAIESDRMNSGSRRGERWHLRCPSDRRKFHWQRIGTHRWS